MNHHPIQSRDNCKKILFLGRIEEEKGIYLLLDAFNEIANTNLEVTLTFAGTGSAIAQLLGKIDKSGFPGRINYLGVLDSVGVHKAIAAHDVIACPTTSRFNEGLALVGFEAAAHGLPTIVSSVVPAAEILAGCCTVFEVDNVESLASAMSELIDQPETFRAQCEATSSVRAQIYDRSRSWGTCLAQALRELDCGQR